MKRNTVTFFAIITLSLLITVYIIEISKPKTQTTLQPTVQHQLAQNFLSDVVGLDLTKYDLTLLPTKKIPKVEYDENNQKYQIESTSNQFKAYVEYENKKIARCRLRWLEQPTQIADHSNDPLEIVKDFLKRYKEFTQEAYLTEIEQILNQVKNTDPITIVSDSGEIIMDIIYKEPQLYFQWSKTINGIENDYNQFSLIFRNNLLAGFSDAWTERAISDVDVLISKDEAISIAKERAKSYTYIFGNTVVEGFKVLDEPFSVELSMQIKDENTVSPLWHIRLALAEVYPGINTEIRVSIWADTREVAYINAVGPLSPPLFDD